MPGEWNYAWSMPLCSSLVYTLSKNDKLHVNRSIHTISSVNASQQYKDIEVSVQITIVSLARKSTACASFRWGKEDTFMNGSSSPMDPNRLHEESGEVLKWLKCLLENSALQIVDPNKVCSQHMLPFLVDFFCLFAREILCFIYYHYYIYW